MQLPKKEIVQIWIRHAKQNQMRYILVSQVTHLLFWKTSPFGACLLKMESNFRGTTMWRPLKLNLIIEQSENALNVTFSLISPEVTY